MGEALSYIHRPAKGAEADPRPFRNLLFLHGRRFTSGHRLSPPL